MPIPQTSPASLDGTLNGMDAQSQADAMAQALAEHLAQQSQQAYQASDQAGQQYQQAAQSPPPDLSALDAFIPTLFGNIASVIGRNPTYSERAQGNIKSQRAELLKARADNLAALRDNFQVKAEAAQKAGDLETEQNSRTKIEQLSKTLQQVNDNIRHGYTMSEIEARGQQARQTQREKPATAPGGAFANFDPKGIAQGVFEGTVPPDPSGFSRGQWGGIVSELRKIDPKFPLMKTVADYKGMIQYVKTLNGNQQVTLRQRSQNAMTTADYIQELIDEIQRNAPARTPVTAINKVQLNTVKNGAWGPDAADAATKLSAQIAAWRLEMAAVYAGGYAPQQQHLKEAENLINDAWAINRIQAGLLIGRRDTGIRLAAVNQQGTAGPSNPVVPGGTGTGEVNIGPNTMPFSQGDQGPATKGPKAKAEALRAARTGDTAALRTLIQNNPELDKDPDLLKLVRKGK